MMCSKKVVLGVVLLTACSQVVPMVIADEATELSYEYIDLLYQLDDLWWELNVLDEMLSSHEEYLYGLDEAIYALDLELITSSHTLAEREAMFSQLDHLMQDCIDMLGAIDDIEDDIESKESEVDEVGYRMAEIEYELTGL